jgi:hypothetical protein
MPPFEEEGVYCFAYVCRVSQLVGHMVSTHYLKNYLSQSLYISHTDWADDP